MNKEELAIRFTINAFNDLRRIKENSLMSYHSICVGFMIKELGLSEEYVITALLHDVIEDTKNTYQDIEELFGKKIADNVLLLSEDKQIKDFTLRKNKFINKIKDVSEELLYIELADKVQNLSSSYQMFLDYGKDVLEIEGNYLENKAYYLMLKDLFNSRIKPCNLLDRFNSLYDTYYK